MRIHDQAPTDTPLEISVGDVEWAADLIDTYREGDIESTVAYLDEMLTRLRKAAKARRLLASVEPVLLRDALGLATTRQVSEP
jgi:hypothetical protein